MRKFILVFIVIAVLLSAGTILYFFLYKEGDSLLDLTETNSEVFESDEKVLADQDVPLAYVSEDDAVNRLEEFQIIIENPVKSPSLSSDNNSIYYYDSLKQYVKESDLIGESAETIFIPRDVVESVVWSGLSRSFIYQTTGGSSYYVNDGEELALGWEINSPVFSSNGESVWYYDENTNSINRASLRNNLFDKNEVVKIKSSVNIVKIPGEEKIVYFEEPSSVRSSAVYEIDLGGEKNLLVNKSRGLNVSWAPNGKRFVFSRMNEQGDVQLWVADENGRSLKNLQKGSFIEKTVWDRDGENLFVSVPKSPLSVDDFYDNGKKGEDRLFKVNVETGQFELVFDFVSESAVAIDARDLFLSENGKLLYFKNSYDDSIYVVNLSKLQK